jgi:Resolvase, N terminal domain
LTRLRLQRLLLEAGVDVRFADLPQIEGATGRFLLQQMVAVAELEAGMISARTKAALAAAKKRGKKLGGNRGVKPTAKMRARSTAVLQQRADARAADIGPTVKALQAAGATSLRAIAAGLNEADIPTARGQGTWSAVQVAACSSASNRRTCFKHRGARCCPSDHPRLMAAAPLPRSLPALGEPFRSRMSEPFICCGVQARRRRLIESADSAARASAQ